ncbi:MAG: hypothetical protein QXG98_00570 [Candidatus Micrarchaeia archaeon]
MRRTALRQRLEREIAKLEKQAEDLEDLHESFTELIVDLERIVGEMYKRLLEKEGARKPGIALIENFVSSGESSLVLRADAIPEKEYARFLEEFNGFRKKLEARPADAQAPR